MSADRILYTDEDVDQIVACKDDRIAALEAALRDLIAMIDPIYDLEPVDRDAFYKAKAALERK